MLILGEPPPSQGDLHFRIFGFPVRVHPFFWLVTLLLGMGGRDTKPADVLIWMVVVFVSILVHELGHAFLQRYYGGRPWITLYSFGGLASCDDCDRSPWPQIIISLAGPVAGFIFAGLMIAIVALTGHVIGFAFTGGRNLETVMQNVMASRDINRILMQPLTMFGVYFEPFRSDVVNTTIADLLQINIMWGILNLLPIYPLDGGRIARELFTIRDARSGVVQSLQLSAGSAALVAAYALFNTKFFMCIMFAMLAYGSFQTWQAYRDRWR
jgi:membrane-associated protease RseP (regulator of RpoE activity)